MRSLTAKAFGGLFFLFVVMAGLLFGPARGFHYWQAWAFLAVYFACSLWISLYLMTKDPQLMQRRMRSGPTAETATAQKIIMWITSAGFIGLLVIPAIDHRLGWSHVPTALAIAGDGLVLLGWLAIYGVFKENTFTSATIELAPDQKVISTGPYAAIRHPMYAGGLVMFAGMPIALGSWWGLLALAAMMPALAWRMFDEEQFLSRNLAGYAAYLTRVRYRLIPGVW